MAQCAFHELSGPVNAGMGDERARAERGCATKKRVCARMNRMRDGRAGERRKSGVRYIIEQAHGIAH